MRSLSEKKAKAVIFDFDGMLFKEEEWFSSKLSREFGIPNEMMKPFFVGDLPRCQKGQLDMKQILGKHLKQWGLDSMSFDSFMKMWFNHGKVNEDLLQYAKDIKSENLIFALITNNEKYRIEYVVEKYDLNEIIDIIVKPYEVGSIKPEKQIYEYTIKKIGLKPSDIIFFDDNKESVEAAREVGMSSYPYKGLDDFKVKVSSFVKTNI